MTGSTAASCASGDLRTKVLYVPKSGVHARISPPQGAFAALVAAARIKTAGTGMQPFSMTFRMETRKIGDIK